MQLPGIEPDRLAALPLVAGLDVETVFSYPAGVPGTSLSHRIDESSRLCLPLCVDRSQQCGAPKS